MKNEKKEYYSIDDIEKFLFSNFNVKKYKKLSDAYPKNKEEWKENYEDVLTYTDGIINSDDYYLFVTQENEDLEDTNGYNEIFLQCSTSQNIPDRMFVLVPWEKSGQSVSDMINVNINYFIELEKNNNPQID